MSRSRRAAPTTTIDAALRLFVVQLRADGRSEHTVAQYVRHVRSFADWLARQLGRLDRDVAAIQHPHVAAFLAEEDTRTRPDGLAKKPTSMNCVRSSVRGFFAYLEGAGLVLNNPARLVRRARCGPPPPRALSVDEERRLRAALRKAKDPAGRRDRALFELLLGTGLRIGSALALRVEDVDLRERVLEVRTTKGQVPMRVRIPTRVMAVLSEMIRGRSSGVLFPTAAGGEQPLSRRHVARRLLEVARRAGIERRLSPHALRHTFATNLLRTSRDIAVVRRALHHASIASTMIYAESALD